MATNTADPMEQDTDPNSATLERKRPHAVISHDDASNTSSAHSTPRKRARYAGKIGHQDVRDFVPVGATFSTSAVPMDQPQESCDDDSQMGTILKAEASSDYEVSGAYESDGAEQEKALVEGRRLLIGDLPPDTTEEDLNQFFKGYSVENIWFPDRDDDNSQIVISTQKEDLSVNGDLPMINAIERADATTTDGGPRLYVGNLSYAATVEDLREFFKGFSLKNVIIPVNPRTHRPVGYAWVTLSTDDDANRAISHLSGSEILERKVSLQRARAEAIKVPDSSISTLEKEVSASKNKDMESSHRTQSIDIEQEPGKESHPLHEALQTVSPYVVQTAPPVNWNAVNTTKIRTTLGRSIGKVLDPATESGLANGSRKETEDQLDQDRATSVALERVEGLRFRLSTMNPHDGPVSAYESVKAELHTAEVDYNYCLYFPSDEAFLVPPTSIARARNKNRNKTQAYRLRLWSMVEQCMKAGTLQDLKEGKVRVDSSVHLDQPSAVQIEQIDGQENLKVATVTDLTGNQALDTQQMTRRHFDFLQAFPKMEPGTRNYERMKKRIHDTEIHLNYSNYFPVTEHYLPLALAKQGVNEINSSKLDGTKARAAQIWKLVEQCTQDGTLQDLRDGRLAAWLKDVPPPNQSSFASALPAKTLQQSTVNNSKAPHSSGPKEASNGDTGPASADIDLIANEEGKSNERRSISESDRGVILNLDYGNQDKQPKIENQILRPGTKSGHRDEEISSIVDEVQEDRHQVTNSGSKNESISSDFDELPNMLLSNLEDKDLQQNLMSEDQDKAMSKQVDNDLYASDGGTASNSDTESNESSADSEGQYQNGDAMMQYSNSEQIVADEGGRNQKTVAVPPNPTASILAELSPHDLNTQLRYFHTTKASVEVDAKTPVRCLVCAKEGHMAESCEHLTCSTCGAFNQHTTRACPNNAKCGRCREQGHDKGHCPYKLKKMLEHELVCDLCQRIGHIEDDCELVWRTSGRPWESDFTKAKVWLSCYECGHSGHLGNNCPSRRPNKAMGTSTWGGNQGPLPIKTTREIKIKGKATRRDPIRLDDSDDERANFYRPKISLPEPVRKGQIRIVTGRRDSPVHEPPRYDTQEYAGHRYSSFTPVNEHHRNEDARQPHQGYRDRGRDNWRAIDELDYGTDYGAGRNDLRYNQYGPSDRRSRSPPYQDAEGYAGGNAWPPSRPAPRAGHQDRRPGADANVYRPMPSAAQNAWTRRRL